MLYSAQKVHFYNCLYTCCQDNKIRVRSYENIKTSLCDDCFIENHIRYKIQIIIVFYVGADLGVRLFVYIIRRG